MCASRNKSSCMRVRYHCCAFPFGKVHDIRQVSYPHFANLLSLYIRNKLTSFFSPCRIRHRNTGDWYTIRDAKGISFPLMDGSSLPGCRSGHHSTRIDVHERRRTRHSASRNITVLILVHLDDDNVYPALHLASCTVNERCGRFHHYPRRASAMVCQVLSCDYALRRIRIAGR